MLFFSSHGTTGIDRLSRSIVIGSHAWSGYGYGLLVRRHTIPESGIFSRDNEVFAKRIIRPIWVVRISQVPVIDHVSLGGRSGAPLWYDSVLMCSASALRLTYVVAKIFHMGVTPISPGAGCLRRNSGVRAGV